LVANEAGEYLPPGLAFKTREDLSNNERIGGEIVQDAQAVTEPVERDMRVAVLVVDDHADLYEMRRDAYSRSLIGLLRRKLNGEGNFLSAESYHPRQTEKDN
jgi:hypothetical protein